MIKKQQGRGGRAAPHPGEVPEPARGPRQGPAQRAGTDQEARGLRERSGGTGGADTGEDCFFWRIIVYYMYKLFKIRILN